MSDQERIRNHLQTLQVKRFSYDHDAKEFTVGARKISVADALMNIQSLQPSNKQVPDVDPMIVTDGRRPIMYPAMYDWLEGYFDTERRSETIEVMQEVFAEAEPRLGSDAIKSEGGFMGFEATRQSEQYPHILLQVLGNCACLSVADFGPFGERVWDSKFASFAAHNIDTPAQRVSIQAGLGHLARRAEDTAAKANVVKTINQGENGIL